MPEEKTPAVEDTANQTPAEGTPAVEGETSSDIDYIGTIEAEIAKLRQERDEALAERDRLKSSPGPTEERERLQQLIASFEGRTVAPPTGAGAGSSVRTDNNQRTAPESAVERQKRLISLFNK